MDVGPDELASTCAHRTAPSTSPPRVHASPPATWSSCRPSTCRRRSTRDHRTRSPSARAPASSIEPGGRSPSRGHAPTAYDRFVFRHTTTGAIVPLDVGVTFVELTASPDRADGSPGSRRGCGRDGHGPGGPRAAQALPVHALVAGRQPVRTQGDACAHAARAGRPRCPSDIVFETMPCGQADGVRIYTPRSGGSGAAVLWIHGGGMIIGAASQDDARCFEIARRLDVVVVSAEYRLAPEHPFPAPLDDCFAAWTWLHDDAAARSIDPTGSRSAGRAPAVVSPPASSNGSTTRAAVQPAAQWLFCPMLDDRTAADRELDATKHILWSNKSNRTGWRAYLGVEPGARRRHRSTPFRPAVPTSPGSHRRGSAPATSNSSTTRTVRTPRRSRPPASSCVLDVVPGAPHGFETVGSGTEHRPGLPRSIVRLAPSSPRAPDA